MPPWSRSSSAVEPVVMVMMSCWRCISAAAVTKPHGIILCARARSFSALPSEMP